jgi:uncharacterized MnhB-related membrane protein
MTALQVMAIVLVGAGGCAVALAYDPLRQALVNSVFGVLLVVLFTVFQAPDVALSALVVTTVALPFIILIALTKLRGPERRE